jgi:hypothetical protein
VISHMHQLQNRTIPIPSGHSHPHGTERNGNGSGGSNRWKTSESSVIVMLGQQQNTLHIIDGAGQDLH